MANVSSTSGEEKAGAEALLLKVPAGDGPSNYRFSRAS
jgi:hypothetical protein